MTIKITCPHCQQRIEASGDVIGTVVSCPNCNEQFRVGRSIPTVEPESVTGASSASPPPIPQPSTPQPSSTKLFRPAYIILALCSLVWLIQTSSMSSHEQQAAPIVAELNRMGSGEYIWGGVIESAARGFMGDPFGKANEESNKEGALRGQLAAIQTGYNSASGWRTLAIWTAIFTGAYLAFNAWRAKRKAK